MTKKYNKRRGPSLRCDQCGAVLINTDNGSLCSEDMRHGRLMPKRRESALERERLVDYAAGLPHAIAYRSKDLFGNRYVRYRIAGIGGYRRHRRIRRLDILHPGVAWANFEGVGYEFRKDEAT